MAAFSEIINSEKPVLIDFYADWCQPCKTLSPFVQEVKQQSGSKAKVIKINVDKNQALSQKLNIQGIPTLMIFKQGELKWRQSGVVPANQIFAELEKHF